MTLSLAELAELRLDESILDDIDVQLATGDKFMDLQRADKWAEKSRKKPYHAKQRKGLLLVGDYEINDIDETQYSGTPIKKVNGNLTITNTELKTLEGLFDIDCEVTGTLTIEDNPSLETIKGHPMQVGTLVIVDNPKLKTIETTPVILKNLYISGNGKKFKKDDLLKNPFVHVYKNIFCSEISDNENTVNEEQINEALKAPQLKILMDAIKAAKDPNSKLTLVNVLGEYKWDAVKASDIYEYDGNDPQAISATKPYRSFKRKGFFFTLDSEGHVLALYRGKSKVALRNRYSKIDKWTLYHEQSATYTDMDIRNADTVVIVDMERQESSYDVRQERYKAKEGALALMRGEERDDKSWRKIDAKNLRYFQEIADKNRQRYSKLVMQMKAERAAKANTFTELKTQIDALFKRYTALLEKILKNPTKYNYYDIDYLNDKFKTTSQISKYSSKDYGLLPAIEKYFNTVIEASHGSTWLSRGETLESKLKELESNIRLCIKSVDEKLTQLENK